MNNLNRKKNDWAYEEIFMCNDKYSKPSQGLNFIRDP